VPGPIHNVVFDIGWVLVRIEYRPLLEFLDRHHGVPAAERDAVMNAVGLEEHECGRMSGEGLLQRIAALAGRQATAAQARISAELDWQNSRGQLAFALGHLSKTEPLLSEPVLPLP